MKELERKIGYTFINKEHLEKINNLKNKNIINMLDKKWNI